MCIIAAKPAGVDWLSKSVMRNCFVNNNDGAGLAWVDETGLRVSKGYFVWKELWKAMQGLKQYPVVLHCRLATHGSVKSENCHPFLLHNGVAVAHNGVIDVERLEKDMTDSESFAIKHIEPWTLDELRSDRVTNLLEQALGRFDKMALLGADGQITLLNGERGVEVDGVWFSNDSYLVDYGSLYDPVDHALPRKVAPSSRSLTTVEEAERCAWEDGAGGCVYSGERCEPDCCNWEARDPWFEQLLDDTPSRRSVARASKKQ